MEMTSVSPTALALASGGSLGKTEFVLDTLLDGLSFDDLDLGLDRPVVEVDDLILEQPVLAHAAGRALRTTSSRSASATPSAPAR